jgi:hypothetical protein
MMAATRDHKQDLLLESQASDAAKRWIQARAEAVRKRVSAHDVLRRNGIQLRYSEDREEQFACPFHGVDRHPSARVYPETVKGPSHVWCFTCHENWDVFKLWGKFSGADNDVRFTRILAEIEKAYGLLPPERPPTAAEMSDHEDPEILRTEMMFALCEDSLRRSRDAFDRKGHLTLGSVLVSIRERGLLSIEGAGGPPTDSQQDLGEGNGPVSRGLTLNTREMGKIGLLLVYDFDGTWEEEWRPLQGHPMAKLLVSAPHDTIEHAILGYSLPLTNALRLSPKELIHKLPSRECEKAKTCPLYIKDHCLPTSKQMPWCFEPSGFSEPVRRLVAELIRLWREGVYVVVVQQPADAR